MKQEGGIMKKIAFEEHFATLRLMQMRGEMMGKMGMKINLDPAELKRTTDLACDLEKRVAVMDECGIAIQVLQGGSNGLEGVEDLSEAAAFATEFNNYMYEAVKKYPGRFECLALLPMQDPEAAAKELKRCVNELGFKGASISGRTLVSKEFLDEEKFYPIWEAAQETGSLLYIHPTETFLDTTAMYKNCEVLNGPTWSWGVDTATYVLRFIFTGLFDRYPDVKLLVGHMGEMLPYLLWRMDNRWRIAKKDSKNQMVPSEYFKRNIYITMSGNLSQAAMDCALEAVGSGHILFAIDYPFESMQETVKCFEEMQLSEADRENIAFRNGENLLNI